MDKIDWVTYSNDQKSYLLHVYFFIKLIAFNSIFMFCNHLMWWSVSNTFLLNTIGLAISQENKIAYYAIGNK